MIYTLPWYAKAGVVAYDVFKCWLRAKEEEKPVNSEIAFKATCSVLGLQAMVVLLLLAPSVCLSVADRVQTNTFCCNVLLLLSAYVLLLRSLHTGTMQAEHVCFLLQFGSAYIFGCFFENTGKFPRLLVGRSIVRLASACCTVLFPVLYSNILPNCMHVSPYALTFVFSGEVFACLCFCASHVLGALEVAIDAAYSAHA